MLYLMIVALYPHHTHSRSTLYIYKVFQYILHTSSLSVYACLHMAIHQNQSGMFSKTFNMNGLDVT
jgi:hypothetical protein